MGRGREGGGGMEGSMGPAVRRSLTAVRVCLLLPTAGPLLAALLWRCTRDRGGHWEEGQVREHPVKGCVCLPLARLFTCPGENTPNRGHTSPHPPPAFPRSLRVALPGRGE